MGISTLAFVGVVGGAGTTTLATETAATLARAGRSAAVLDAAYATQGLATYIEGRIDGDVTGVTTDDRPLEDALYEWGLDAPGEVLLCPAHAPFERLARAKAPTAAQRFEDAVAAAAERVDHVLLDTPPVAANQAVAAATTAQRRALVAPDSRRGADLLARQRGRLRDIDAPADAVVATRAGDELAPDADFAVPPIESTTRPASLDPASPVAPAVADVAEGLLETELDLTFEDEGLLEGLR